MATGDVDIASLTESQQLALQQFTSVTDQDLSAAIPLLQKCEWNVQVGFKFTLMLIRSLLTTLPIAIARFFDGEPAPIPDDLPNIPPLQPTRRTDTLANGFSSPLSTLSPSSRSFEPAPRVAIRPENQITQRPPVLVSLFLTPINFVYTLFSRVFGLFSYLFPFLPRFFSRFNIRPSSTRSQRNAGGRRPLGPQDTTARFLREFEEEYGAHTLPFLETGYSRAFDLAKRELKFLVAIPLSPEHDNTSSFVRDILLTESVVSFFNDPSNNVLLWAGSVQDSEAYQVSSSLNITKFPTAAVIAHTPSVSATAMSVVGRIAAPTSPEEFLAKVQAAITQNSESMSRARAMRAEQEASRNLREQQNSAYERSLAQDRERARLKREAEAVKARAEKDACEREEKAKRYERDLAQWRRWRAASLPAEPAPDVKDAVRISLRLLNGERIMRRFSTDAEIEEVYALAECWDIISEGNEKAPSEPAGFTHKYEFRLVSPIPRRVFEFGERGSVKEKIGRSGNLIMERLEEENEESVV